MNRIFPLSVFVAVLLCTAVQAQLSEYKRTQHPNYSPDGKLIVFSATITKVRDDLSKGISVMNADGTQVRSVTSNSPGIFDEFPSLSKDGKRKVFLRRATGSKPEAPDVFLVNTDGTGLTRLTSTPEKELRPEFNHDDTAVVFVRDFSPNASFRFGSLHVVDIATQKETQILGKEYQVSHAVPAPRNLYFIAAAKKDPAGKPLDVISNGSSITLVSPTGELYPRSPLSLPESKSTISRIQFVTVGKEFVMYVQEGGLFGNALLITPKGVEKFEDIDFSLSPDGTKLLKWGNGYSVYVRGIRDERGISVGTK